jgi:hypothetical protein
MTEKPAVDGIALVREVLADLKQMEWELRHPWAAMLIERAQRREPDFVIGGRDDPYMRRWWITPRLPRMPGVYLHQFLRSDSDSVTHDHPWASVSILLRGSYTEHFKDGASRILEQGEWCVRRATTAHRIELHDGPVWSLFLHGFKTRDWFFHCPQGLVHWRDFVDGRDSGVVGKGCGE